MSQFLRQASATIWAEIACSQGAGDAAIIDPSIVDAAIISLADDLRMAALKRDGKITDESEMTYYDLHMLTCGE